MKKTRSIKIFLTICLCLTILLIMGVMVSCNGINQLYSEGKGSLQVVATTFIPFDLARTIGGEDVTVTILQDSGADLHNYTPTGATLAALAKADVFIYIGGESDEIWVPDAIKACENTDLLTVCLMDAIAEPLHAQLQNDWSDHQHVHEDHKEHEGHHHHADEHIWTSPKNGKAMTEAIQKALCQKAPSLSEKFTERAEALIAELQRVGQEYTEMVNSAKVRSVVVADRFPFVYLFHDYKIGYLAAFSGCSTEINSSFETQISLINAVKTQNIETVLTIEGGNKPLAEGVSNETGCKILTLNSMQSVKHTDIKAGITYLDLLHDNLLILREALS